MRTLKSLVLGVAAAMAISATASATDVYAPGYGSVENGGFDWSGMYVGKSVGVQTLAGDTYWHVGALGGYSMMLDPNWLLGFEIEVGYFTGPSSGFDAYIYKRIGYVSGNYLLFGALGLGVDDGTTLWAIAGGVEAAVGNDMSVRASVEGAQPLGGGNTQLSLDLSLLFHL